MIGPSEILQRQIEKFLFLLIEMDRVFGDSGMLAMMVIVPLIPSELISFAILQNRQWISYTLILTLIAGLYLVFSCFYCIG